MPAETEFIVSMLILLLPFRFLPIPAFRVPGFTDSFLSRSGFYRFPLFVFLVLQIPAFRVPGFTDSGFSHSGFYRFRLFVFRVLQIPALRVPGFLVPRSVPRFPVPCFTDSRMPRKNVANFSNLTCFDLSGGSTKAICKTRNGESRNEWGMNEEYENPEL